MGCGIVGVGYAATQAAHASPANKAAAEEAGEAGRQSDKENACETSPARPKSLPEGVYDSDQEQLLSQGGAGSDLAKQRLDLGDMEEGVALPGSPEQAAKVTITVISAGRYPPQEQPWPPPINWRTSLCCISLCISGSVPVYDGSSFAGMHPLLHLFAKDALT